MENDGKKDSIHWGTDYKVTSFRQDGYSTRECTVKTPHTYGSYDRKRNRGKEKRRPPVHTKSHSIADITPGFREESNESDESGIDGSNSSIASSSSASSISRSHESGISSSLSEADFITLLRNDASQPDNFTPNDIGLLPLTGPLTSSSTTSPARRKNIRFHKTCSPLTELSEGSQDGRFTSHSQLESDQDRTPQAVDINPKDKEHLNKQSKRKLSEKTPLIKRKSKTTTASRSGYRMTGISEPGCLACFEAMEELRTLYYTLTPELLKQKNASPKKTLSELIISLHTQFKYFFISLEKRQQKCHPDADSKKKLDSDILYLSRTLEKQKGNMTANPINMAITETLQNAINKYAEAQDVEDVPEADLSHELSYDLINQLLIPVINVQLMLYRETAPDPAGTLLKLRQTGCPAFIQGKFASSHLERWGLSAVYNCTADNNMTGRTLESYFSLDIKNRPNPENLRLDMLRQQTARIFKTLEDLRSIIKAFHNHHYRQVPDDIEQQTQAFKTVASILSTQCVFAETQDDIQQLDVIVGLMYSWLRPDGTLHLPDWVYSYTNRFSFYHMTKTPQQKESLSFNHIPSGLLPLIKNMCIPVLFEISWQTGEELAACILNPRHDYHQEWPVIRTASTVKKHQRSKSTKKLDRPVSAPCFATPYIPTTTSVDKMRSHLFQTQPSPCAGKHLESIAKAPTHHIPPQEMISLAWLYLYQLSVVGEEHPSSQTFIKTIDNIYRLFDLVIKACPTPKLPPEHVKACTQIATKLYKPCEGICSGRLDYSILEKHPIVLKLAQLPEKQLSEEDNDEDPDVKKSLYRTVSQRTEYNSGTRYLARPPRS